MLFHVVPDAQYVVKRAGVLFAEPQHLGSGVEHLGGGVRLGVYDGPASAVAYGVAILDAPVCCIAQNVARAVRNHTSHVSQVRRFVGLFRRDHGGTDPALWRVCEVHFGKVLHTELTVFGVLSFVVPCYAVPAGVGDLCTANRVLPGHPNDGLLLHLRLDI